MISLTFGVLNDLGGLALHDSNSRVGGSYRFSLDPDVKCQLRRIELTQINTDNLTLHLLLTTFRRVPSPERSAGSSEGRRPRQSSGAGDL